MPILETQALTKIFGGLTAVNEVSFAVPERTIASIIGPNGAGKTTFFNMLTGLYKPSLGRVEFRGKDITARRPDRITNLGVARTFQNIRLFGELSVLENVRMEAPMRLPHGIFSTAPAHRPARGGQALIDRRSCELLDIFGLHARRFEQAKNLPYGDRRRLEIARAWPLSPGCCCWTSRRPG